MIPQVVDRQAQNHLLKQLLYGELKALLNRWGDWMERHREDTGLPTQTSFLNVPSSLNGHRVLCAQMPKKVWHLHRAIVMLEPKHQDILMLWYGIQRTPEGEWLDGKRKAAMLEINERFLWVKVHLARKELLTRSKVWAI